MADRVSKGTQKHSLNNPSDDRPKYLRDQKFTIAVDTETTGFDWYSGDYPFYGTITDYDRDYGYDLTSSRGGLEFDAAIVDAETLIFHNASFDIHMIASMGSLHLEVLLGKEIHDTDLLARIVLGNEAGRFGLKPLATSYLDPLAGQYEKAVKECMVSMGLIKKVDQKESPPGSYFKVWKAYPDILEKYALMDTHYTYHLFYLLMERATEHDLAVYELERAVLPEIIRMEHRGTQVVPERVSELLAKHRVLRSQTEERLNELNGYEPINPESGNEVVEFLKRRGIVLTETTDKGEIRTDKNVLERYSGDEAVDLILDHRGNNKLITTYLEPMENRDIVHPNYRQIGAWTGRMSGYRPNMQNIPTRSGPEIRSMFVPRDDHALVVADYASIELRLLAYYMNDSDLWEIINTGDPFEWMGERIYGTREQKLWKVPRSNLKNGTYAIIYGAGGPKLAKTIGGGMSDAEGRALKRSITDSLGPRYYALQRRVRQAVESHGYVRTLAGRTQYVPTNKSYVGLNALIQGSAADIMKWGLVNSAHNLRKLNAHILLTTHDELVTEVPLTQLEQGCEALQAGLESATLSLPLKAEVTVCYNNYGEAK